jgi:hypothetical protein
MLTSHGRKQPREEPDKAWLWIAGSLTLVILAICAVLYAHARNCGPCRRRLLLKLASSFAAIPPPEVLRVGSRLKQSASILGR